MNEIDFNYQTLHLKSISRDDLKAAQNVLDHASYYHTSIVRYPPTGLAERCFQAQPPEVTGNRVFKRFLLVEDKTVYPGPLGTLDLFVGFPDYKTASIAMLVIREEAQRKGVGFRLLTEAIPALLREYHPAVENIRVSLTDNNTPAMRCLLKCKYVYANSWEKLDIKGRPVTAVSYTYHFR